MPIDDWWLEFDFRTDDGKGSDESAWEEARREHKEKLKHGKKRR